MKSGVDIIAEERKRQLEVEGWKPEGDDQYVDNQLALAGASYAIPEVDREYFGTTEDNVPVMFPFSSVWWKPSPENRIKELAKAGALIAAEIDRLQRLGHGEDM